VAEHATVEKHAVAIATVAVIAIATPTISSAGSRQKPNRLSN
jgi:hypothetical protein